MWFGCLALVLADPVDRDHVALVGGGGDGRAVEGLQPLGRRHAGGEAAGDVHGDVMAADRDRVDVDEVAAGEHAEAGRAAAHVDDADAHLGLVVDERREPRRVGRRDHRLDPEVAMLDRQHDVAGGGQLAGDHVKVDAERLADHARRDR